MRRMKLQSQVTFRVTSKVYKRLQEIAEKERRKMNEVARALLDRGLAAYGADEKLFQPEAGGDIRLNPKGGQKKKAG
jgi:hypothetical protein